MKSMTTTDGTVLVRSQAMLLLVMVASAMLLQTVSPAFTTIQSSVSILIGTHAFMASSTTTTTRRRRHRHDNASASATSTKTLKGRRTLQEVVESGWTEDKESEELFFPNTVDRIRMRREECPSMSFAHEIRGESMAPTSNVVDRRSFWSSSTRVTVGTTLFCLSIPQLSWADIGASKYPKSSSIPSSSSSSSLSLGLVEDGPERIKLKRKPSAPVGALVPSIQQRLLLEVCIDAAKNKDLQKLKSIIPPLSSSTTTSSNSRSSSSNQLRLLKQNDPSRVLCGDVTRAAMDLYQVNLNYNTIFDDESDASTDASTNTDRNSSSAGPSFPAVKDVIDITDPVWKKSYIRDNDGLNSDFVSKVIGADIDLRQLLRNQVQTNLDDAAAELYYVSARRSRSTGNAYDDDDDIEITSICDCDELFELLQSAAKNFDLWLERVGYGDVRDAIQIVLSESSSSSSSSSINNLRIYESYQAGFIPPPPQPSRPTLREPK